MYLGLMIMCRAFPLRWGLALLRSPPLAARVAGTMLGENCSLFCVSILITTIADNFRR